MGEMSIKWQEYRLLYALQAKKQRLKISFKAHRKGKLVVMMMLVMMGSSDPKQVQQQRLE